MRPLQPLHSLRRLRSRRRVTPAALAALAVTVVTASATVLTTAPARAADAGAGRGRTSTFAVIGDVPYGDAQLAAFPGLIAQINADPDVSIVTHLGDIKSGSTQCTDAYFATIRADVDTFTDPFVYTPGDNEWTDCLRANNGAYNPLERLAAVRRVFFDRPGRTLGKHPVRVEDDARAGFPENVRYERAGVQFAALHVVGSDNSLAPWTGNTAPTPEQAAEVAGRTADVLKLLRETFAQARHEHSRAVVLQMQADMFDPTAGAPTEAGFGAFGPIVRAISAESARFGRPVYLFNGDSHVYNADHPLAAGSAWTAFYGSAPAGNLTRITVDGSADATKDWLKVTIDPKDPAVLTWQRVPYTGV